MRSVSGPVKLFVVTLCSVVGLSAVGMMVASSMLAPTPVWVLFGFELVVASAGVLGVLFGLGRFQDGQGLALACVSGTIAVASFLGWLGSQHRVTIGHADISLTAWLLGRLLAAAALGLVGAWLVLSRNPKSWSYVIKAVITGGPLVLLAGVYVLKRSALTSVVDHLPGWVAGTAALLGGFAAVGLISASVHCLIRAFELGRTEA